MYALYTTIIKSGIDVDKTPVKCIDMFHYGNLRTYFDIRWSQRRNSLRR